jgi:hypothetical protein
MTADCLTAAAGLRALAEAGYLPHVVDVIIAAVVVELRAATCRILVVKWRRLVTVSVSPALMSPGSGVIVVRRCQGHRRLLVVKGGVTGSQVIGLLLYVRRSLLMVWIADDGRRILGSGRQPVVRTLRTIIGSKFTNSNLCITVQGSNQV